MPSKKISFGDSTSLVKATKEENICFVQFPDCFVERVLLDELGQGFQKQYAASLTIMWLEDNVLSPGLFGPSGPVLVLDAEQLPKNVQTFLEETTFPEDAKIIFSSSKKIKNKALEKKFLFIISEGPKFWAMNEYVDFLAQSFGMKLGKEIVSHLLSVLSGTPESFYNAIMILSAYPKNEINLDLVKSIFRPSKLDNFALSDLFNVGNMKRVYLSLLLIEDDFDSYRNFFSFIQGHIIKIMDPSYSSGKKKLSKYDQGILSASKRWTRTDLTRKLKEFSELEILSKQKSRWLRDELRKGYLRP